MSLTNTIMGEKRRIHGRKFGLRRIKNKIFLHIATKTPFINSFMRARISKWGGVNILNPNNTRIGYEVIFDTIYPEEITIGENTGIAPRVAILSHFATGEYKDFIMMTKGRVTIGNNAWIGMNTVIAKPVTIGDGAIIGANSVVICDIPPYTIWGGNPAKYIKDRGMK